MTAPERVSTYRDRLAEAFGLAFAHAGNRETTTNGPLSFQALADVALAVRDAELGRVRAQTIRDLRAGRVPLAEIAAAQGITGPQDPESLHTGIDLTDEEYESFMATLAEARSDPDRERADRLTEENTRLTFDLRHAEAQLAETRELLRLAERDAVGNEALLIAGQGKIDDLLSSVRTIAGRLTAWCRDDTASKTIAGSIAADLKALAEINPPPGDTRGR